MAAARVIREETTETDFDVGLCMATLSDLRHNASSSAQIA
jgi:hypothetical protein